MMISVADTPFGRALARFLMLFEERPLPIEQPHLAYAGLSDLAAQEHADMSWPLPMQKEGNTYSYVRFAESFVEEKIEDYDWSEAEDTVPNVE